MNKLPLLKASEVTKPGKYICIPLTATLKLCEMPDYLFFTDVYFWEELMLVYKTEDGEEHTFSGCTSGFYGPLES